MHDCDKSKCDCKEMKSMHDCDKPKCTCKEMKPMHDCEKSKCTCKEMKPMKMEYARAYIRLQAYGNLFSIKDALKKGTIFKDLYSPYDENKKSKC